MILTDGSRYRITMQLLDANGSTVRNMSANYPTLQQQTFDEVSPWQQVRTIRLSWQTGSDNSHLSTVRLIPDGVLEPSPTPTPTSTVTPTETPSPTNTPIPTETPTPAFNVIVVDAAGEGSAGAQSQQSMSTMVDVPPPGTPDDGICTVREAIEKANYWSSTENPDPNMPFPDCVPGGLDSSRPNQVIVNLYPTTYTLYYPLVPISGSVFITTDEVNYPNSFATIVRSDIVTEKFRIFEITSEQGASLTLKNIIVSNGYAEGNGGGILNAGTLTLINSTVIDNYATGSGGGIYNTGDLFIDNSLIQSNTSIDMAGAIYNESPLSTIISNSCIANNDSAFDRTSIVALSPLTGQNNWWGGAGGPSFNAKSNAEIVVGLVTDTAPSGSGKTGNATGEHLHATVFYSPEKRRLDPERMALPMHRSSYQWYFWAYDLGFRNLFGRDYYGNSRLVNPLVLWPSAQQDTQCPYWQILQSIAPGTGG